MLYEKTNYLFKYCKQSLQQPHEPSFIKKCMRVSNDFFIATVILVWYWLINESHQKVLPNILISSQRTSDHDRRQKRRHRALHSAQSALLPDSGMTYEVKPNTQMFFQMFLLCRSSWKDKWGRVEEGVSDSNSVWRTTAPQ